MNRATKMRVAAHKRWRAMMQTPGFRACYKRLKAHLRAMHTPCVVVPFATLPGPYDGVRLFNERPAPELPRVTFNPMLPLMPIEDATASLERENARSTRLQWLVWPA